MKKHILNILLLTMCVSMSAAEPEALILQGVMPHSVLLDDIQRITFSNGDLLLKTTAGSQTAFSIDDISKIHFGDMITVGNVGAGLAPAQVANIVGYYSILGQRLTRELESGVYIIIYDNGKAEKIVR